MNNVYSSKDLHTIKQSVVERYAPIELKAFLDTLASWANLSLKDYAKYVEENDTHYLLEEKQGEDEIENALDLLDLKFIELISAFEKKTGAELSLFAASSYVHVGEDKAYWTVDNFYIRNPAICEELIDEVAHTEIITGE